MNRTLLAVVAGVGLTTAARADEPRPVVARAADPEARTTVEWMVFSPDGRHLAVRETVLSMKPGRKWDEPFNRDPFDLPFWVDDVATAYDAGSGKPVSSVLLLRSDRPLPFTEPRCVFPSGTNDLYGWASATAGLPRRPGGAVRLPLDPAAFRPPFPRGRTSFAADPAGKHLYAVTTDLDKPYEVRRFALGKSAREWAAGEKLATAGDPRSESVWALALDPASGRFAAAVVREMNWEAVVECWTPGDMPAKITLTPPVRVDALAFAPGARLLAVGDTRGSAGWYDLAGDGKLTLFEDLGRFTVAALAFAPDGKHLVCGSFDGKGRPNLFVLSVERKAVVRRVVADPNAVTAIVFSPDGSRLAVYGGSGAITLWDVAGLVKPAKE